MGLPKQPGIIDAKITEEYVICGVCLTKNRIVSHKKVVRPVCGRCGYPLPDPFGAQGGVDSFGEWITRYRRVLAVVAGLLLIGLLLWLVSGREEHSFLLSGQRREESGRTLADHSEAAVYAVVVVVRREASINTDEERAELAPQSLPSRTDWQPDGLYGLRTPNADAGTESGSVIIAIDVPAGRVREHIDADNGYNGELPAVFVLSRLQPMTGDLLNLLVVPRVIEQIHIDAGLDWRG